MSNSRWEKLGLILSPENSPDWCNTYSGPASIARPTANQNELWMSGRGRDNQSRIGRVILSSGSSVPTVEGFSEVEFEPGELGAFDESGVSYPILLESKGVQQLFYVGWVSGGKTRFQNYLGVARRGDASEPWIRVNRAPILERTTQEPFGSGSCDVLLLGDELLMYYTAFLGWAPGKGDKPTPHYEIRIASSEDNGASWRRHHEVAIPSNHEKRTIARPATIVLDGQVHMFFSQRGDRYEISHAVSKDGRKFEITSSENGLQPSAEGWDSEMVEYGFPISRGGQLYLLYNGNQFGQSGLGIARNVCPLDKI